MADGFALFIAVVNRVPDRDLLIRELALSAPDLTFSTVRLNPETSDPLDDVLRQAGDPPPGPVMVVDFDVVLPSAATYHPILQTLNLHRPKWPEVVTHPVVFWLPDYVLTLLAREAADFLDWRSITVFFTEGKERDLIPLRSEIWEGGINHNFTLSQRLARVAELASRLALYGKYEKDRHVQAARIAWLNELGIHQRMVGDLRTAISSYDEVIALARELGEREAEASGLGNLGNTYASFGETKRAIEYLEQSLAILREVGDRRGEAAALGNLGSIYGDLGNDSKAIEYLEMCLRIARELKDQRAEGIALGNLGTIYFQMGNAAKATVFHQEALKIAVDLGDRQIEGRAIGNLGLASAALGDFREGLAYHQQHATIAKEMGDKWGEGAALFNSALRLMALGQRDEARLHAVRALTIFEELESPFTGRVRRKLAEWSASSPPGSVH